MMRGTLAWLAQRIGAELIGSDRAFAGVQIDSRRITEGALFVALPGERVDGHDFVAAVAAQGAAAAIVRHALPVSLPQLVVGDTERALGEIARQWRAQCAATVIGITGSNGKTSLKTLTHGILSRRAACAFNPGNLNNEIGLPLSLCALAADVPAAVFEMGAGKPGDIAYLTRIARPDISVVNNVAPAHLERMGSVRGVAETKGAIYADLPSHGVAVIPADDAFAPYFRDLVGKRARLSFGIEHAADVSGRIVAADAAGQHIAIRTPAGRFDVTLPLAGRHNAQNALAATALCLAAGASLDQIRDGLAQAERVPGRLIRRVLANGAVLIDDSYNANPGSMRAAIDTLALDAAPRWLVIGDMKELGDDTARLHHDIGVLARERGIDRMFAVGELSRHACAGFGAGAEHFSSQSPLIDALRAELATGITLLIKGSRSSAMDRVANALLDPDAAHAATGGSHAA